MQLTRKQHKKDEVLEVHNGSLQKVFSRLIKGTHGPEAWTLGKFKTWMNIKSHVGTHKRARKKFHLFRRTISQFLCQKISSNFFFMKWIGTKALHRDLMESTMVTGIILSLDKKCCHCSPQTKTQTFCRRQTILQFPFLLEDRLLRTFFGEIKRCKCSLITFIFRLFKSQIFVRFHRFLRTRKFHSRFAWNSFPLTIIMWR
jgi:hypothetical protein